MRKISLTWVFFFLLFLFSCRETNDKKTSVYRSLNKKVAASILPSRNDHLKHSAGVDIDYNTIKYFGEQSPLTNFYEKLKRLKNGGLVRINIGHFGGSHVQAGQLTSFLRHQFAGYTPNARGERGFLFPSRIIKSNGPDYSKIDYSGAWTACKCANNNHHCDWGIAGQSAITKSDTSLIKSWAFDVDSLLYPFNKVRIYRKDPNNAFDVVSKKVCSARATKQYIDLTFDSLQDTLDIEIINRQQGDFAFELQGFLFRNDKKVGISYHGLGVNGAGIKSYLRCDLFEDQLQDLDLDLVIIGLGLNDTYVPRNKFNPEKLKASYQELIERIKAKNPFVNILLMTNNDHYFNHKKPNPNSLLFNTLIEELARENDLAFYDLFHVMGGMNSIINWEEKGLAKPDLIHFTSEGYRLQANLLFDALMSDFSVRKQH